MSDDEGGVDSKRRKLEDSSPAVATTPGEDDGSSDDEIIGPQPVSEGAAQEEVPKRRKGRFLLLERVSSWSPRYVPFLMQFCLGLISIGT